MKTIHADQIRDLVAELCIRANRELPEDIVRALTGAAPGILRLFYQGLLPGIRAFPAGI